MLEPWVRSLGWEDLLEKGKATHSSIMENFMDWIVRGVPKSLTWLSNFHFHFPKRYSGKESSCQCKRLRFDPWFGMIPWRRTWLPIPVFLPGVFHRERSLEYYSPWGHKRVRHGWSNLARLHRSLPYPEILNWYFELLFPWRRTENSLGGDRWNQEWGDTTQQHFLSGFRKSQGWNLVADFTLGGLQWTFWGPK